MATPTQRSLSEIVKNILQTFVAKSGVNDVSVGSSSRSFMEAAALSDFKTQGDIIAALASTDIDNVSNADLDKIGTGKGVARPQARPANGVVTISQANFAKISSKVFQGTAAPPAGSVTVNVADGSLFPSTGSVYIGRGTSNLEGPIAYTSITPVGSYYQITLSAATTKNHNLGETIILAQGGNRVISTGANVQTKSTLTSSSVTFRTLATVTLLDGEASISDVPVVCTATGTIGNVAAGAVQEFGSPPFPNAVATNPLGFVSGSDTMSDPDYRQLIKNKERTKVKATDLAVKQAAIGVQSSDDSKIVTSAEIRKPSNRGEPSNLFIDDGTGYQPIFKGQGFEQIIDNANGGEKYLTLQKQDLTKALIVSALEAPFALTGGMTLSILVGETLSEHTFSASDFATANAADTFEVVNSINNNSALTFSARATDNNKRVSIFAKDFQYDDLQVTSPLSSTNANDFLGLPTTLTYSLRLYKNEVVMIKDGIIPTIYSGLQSSWAGSIASGDTLIVKVDGIQQTATVIDSDFIPYGYATVSKNNPLSAWASVLHSKIAGIGIEVESGKLKLTSNDGASNQASLEIVGGTLVTSGLMFTQGDFSQGKAKDYNLNRSTGQIELASAAVAGDVFTAGSKNTRAFLDSVSLSSGSVTLAASPTPKLWLVIDANSVKIAHGSTGGSTISVTQPVANTWRYTSSVAGAFSSVLPGDWLIVTDNAGFTVNNVGYWRVTAATATYCEVLRTTGGTVETKSLGGVSDITFTRSEGAVQQITLPSGLQTISALATAINNILIGGFAQSVGGNILRIFSNTFNPIYGKIYMAAFNSSASALGFVSGYMDLSNISHTAFIDSNEDSTFIDFVHDTIATGDATVPYNTVITTLNLDTLGYNPNYTINWLNPYGTSISSNVGITNELANLTGTTATLKVNPKTRDIISLDRYLIEIPYDFNSQDNVVAILDKDTVNKTFNISMGRKGKVYSSSGASTFKSYDLDFNPTANWASSFGNNFDFSNFKLHFKARAVLDPAGANNKMMIKSSVFGPTGNRTKFGIFYPTSENSAVSHSASVDSDTAVRLYIATGAVRSGGAWDATTEFDITEPVSNTWRYTWNTNGTAPSFLASGAVTGDIVSITSASTVSSNNTGAYKVTAITNIYFEVTKYSGTSETGKTLSSPASLKFYPLAGTTATDLGTYINASVTDYLSAVQLESGAGTIDTTTYDDSLGVSSYIQLQDGENWALSTNIGTVSVPVNDFTLKKPLNIFGPNLLNEEFYIIPTRAEQLKRYLNVFAVAGISSLGNVSTSISSSAIQIYSNLFGSSGAIQISGGTANSVAAAVQDSGSINDANFTKFAIPKAAARGFHANQWVKLTNSATLAKNIGIGSGTQMSFVGQAPTANHAQLSVTNSSNGNIHQYGYFQTKRIHDGDATTQMRLEKQGQFVALSWTGTGTQPKLSRQFTVSNHARTSSISTITVSAPHNIALNSFTTITVVDNTNSSFSGTFRAIASSSTDFQYRQDGLANIGSAVATGTVVRKVVKNDRMKLSGVFTSGNAGEFIVSNVYGSDTIYFENANVVYGDYTLSANSDLQVFSYDSVRPGDTLSIGSSILDDNSAPIEIRKNDYIVDVINSDLQITLLTPTLTKSSTSTNTLGSDYVSIKAIEALPFFMYAKIKNIATSAININNADVIIEGTDSVIKITSAGSTSMSGVSKLGFSTSVASGEDSYKYYGGLIASVGKVIRGDPSDPVTYPGYAAAGSYIETDAALQKRIQVSIVIRNRTGTPFATIRSRVQTSVASYINSLGVGVPVVFSEIISAAQSINGVQAVSISSPNYSASNDQIVSQPNQKPIVISLETDIIVSLAT